MSAPGPRAGSSGRCGRSGSSPKTMRWASVTSVPGSEPIPVAAPAGHGNSATGHPADRLRLGGSAGRDGGGSGAGRDGGGSGAGRDGGGSGAGRDGGGSGAGRD